MAVDFKEVAKKYTREEFLRTGRLGSCPNTFGFGTDCNKSCLDCWRDAVEREKFIDDRDIVGKMEIYLKGDTTVAIYREEGKTRYKKGIAKKHVDDKYSALVGVTVATARAFGVNVTELLDIFTNKELISALYRREIAEDN